MNYDNLNKTHQYWRKDLFPNLVHRMSTCSFDDYLRKFAFLSHGKWLWDMEKVKLARLIFVVDPKKFMKKYKDCCVTYNAPVRPEDGFQRIIYQISPTLHLETGIWIWMELGEIQSYMAIFACYNDEDEFIRFVDDAYKLRREGNSEDNPTPGFAGFVKPGFMDGLKVIKDQSEESLTNPGEEV